jgi:hypothetical protein
VEFLRSIREMPMAIEWPADSGSQELSSIMVGFAGPMRQDRLTVLTRLILAIPHFISLLVAMIATLMVIVGGWFGHCSGAACRRQ